MQNNIQYKEALDNAVASVEIEGYEVFEYQKESCLEFINGNINREEFIKIICERCVV